MLVLCAAVAECSSGGGGAASVCRVGSAATGLGAGGGAGWTIGALSVLAAGSALAGTGAGAGAGFGASARKAGFAFCGCCAVAAKEAIPRKAIIKLSFFIVGFLCVTKMLTILMPFKGFKKSRALNCVKMQSSFTPLVANCYKRINKEQNQLRRSGLQ